MTGRPARCEIAAAALVRPDDKKEAYPRNGVRSNWYASATSLECFRRSRLVRPGSADERGVIESTTFRATTGGGELCRRLPGCGGAELRS